MPFEQEYVAHSFMINLEKNGFSLSEFLEANQERKNEIFAILGANNPNQLKLDLPEENSFETACNEKLLSNIHNFKKKTDAAL
jgi:hypothetical protein